MLQSDEARAETLDGHKREAGAEQGPQSCENVVDHDAPAVRQPAFRSVDRPRLPDIEKAEEGDPLAMYLCALYVAPGIERQEDLCVDENFLNKMFFWLVSAANAELPKAMDILEDNYDESLTLTDGTERWFSNFYDIIEPDGETSFRPEFVLK